MSTPYDKQRNARRSAACKAFDHLVTAARFGNAPARKALGAIADAVPAPVLAQLNAAWPKEAETDVPEDGDAEEE